MPQRYWTDPSTNTPYVFPENATDAQISTFIHQKTAPPPASTGNPGDVGSYAPRGSVRDPNMGGTPIPELGPENPTNSIIDTNRAMSVPAALAIARQAATATPGPLQLKALVGAGAGATAYLGADKLAQRAMGDEPKDSSSLINLIVSEGGGRLFSKIGEKAKGAYQAAHDYFSPPEPTMPDRLGATLAQRLKSPLLGHVEDIFAGTEKQNALKNSGQQAKKIGEEKASELSGMPKEEVSNPATLSEQIKGNVADSYKESQDISNGHAAVAREIGDANPKNVLTGYAPQPKSALVNNPYLSATPVYSEVKGPVPVAEAYGWARKILSDHPNPELLATSGEKAVYAKARDIAAKAEVKDTAGNIVATRPISFGDAWEFKKAADQLQNTDPRFKQLSAAFNRDIEDGIATWQHGSDQAAKSWNASKAEVQRRITVFDNDKSIAGMLNSNDTVTPEVSKAIADPKRLTRLLATQSGTGQGNIRKLAQGYDLQEILQNSYDPLSGTFNSKKIADQWGDPTRDSARKILYSDESRRSIDSFLKAVQDVSHPESGIGKAGTGFKVTGAGIALGAGLLEGGTEFLGGPRGLTAGIILGGSLSLKALGKIATNPKLAPLAEKMIKGEPLGMSQQLAARILFNNLAGQQIKLQLQGGKTADGTIVPGGKIQLDDQK